METVKDDKNKTELSIEVINEIDTFVLEFETLMELISNRETKTIEALGLTNDNLLMLFSVFRKDKRFTGNDKSKGLSGPNWKKGKSGASVQSGKWTFPDVDKYLIEDEKFNHGNYDNTYYMQVADHEYVNIARTRDGTRWAMSYKGPDGTEYYNPSNPGTWEAKFIDAYKKIHTLTPGEDKDKEKVVVEDYV